METLSELSKETNMSDASTGILLIGYQNDYFAKDGILQSVVEESLCSNNVLDNTLALLERVAETDVAIISTPITFTPDYRELDNPIGILKICKDVGAFMAGSSGAEVIEELKRWGERIMEIPGKRGLNAFSNTSLETMLVEKGITDLVIAGVVTSVCIDSTARAASDKGFNVTVLSDCTAGRTNFEQEFYCSDIFPIFANVKKSTEIL